MTAFQVMSAADYSLCGNPITREEAYIELDTARDNGLIDIASYDWAGVNGYYPTMNRAATRIMAVCAWGCFEKSTQVFAYDDSRNQQWIAVDSIQLGITMVQLSDWSFGTVPATAPSPITRITQGPEETALRIGLWFWSFNLRKSADWERSPC